MPETTTNASSNAEFASKNAVRSPAAALTSICVMSRSSSTKSSAVRRGTARLTASASSASRTWYASRKSRLVRAVTTAPRRGVTVTSLSDARRVTCLPRSHQGGRPIRGITATVGALRSSA